LHDIANPDAQDVVAHINAKTEVSYVSGCQVISGYELHEIEKVVNAQTLDMLKQT